MKKRRPVACPKQRYRITNWPEYNRALIDRGSLTLWIDDEVVRSWRAPSGRGRRYSDTAILCALSLKTAFSLTLRQTRGFLESLKRLLGLTIPIPDYTTLSRRAAGLEVPVAGRLRPGEPVHLVIDSTGLKVFGEGEWKVRVHGKEKKRTWRKLHLGADARTGEVLAHELTVSESHDGPQLPGLLDQVDGPIKAVYGDKAYDSFACHKAVLARDAMPVLIPRRGASIHPPPSLKDPPPTRGAIVSRIHRIGRKEWKKESGYHRRSLAETAMFRYKTLIDDRLSAIRIDNQKTEAAIGVRVLNRFTALGMPVSVPVT